MNKLKTKLKQLKYWKQNKSNSSTALLDEEDKMSLLTLVFVIIALALLLSTKSFSGGTYPKTLFQKIIEKSMNGPVKCATYNDNFERCVASQKAGLGCGWIASCGACIGVGDIPEKICQQKLGQKLNNLEKINQKTEVVKQVDNCEEFNSKFEQCVSMQKSQGTCFWYADCGACLNKGVDPKAACERIMKTSKTSPTPTQIGVLTPTQAKKQANCREYDSKYDQCVKLQKEGYDCSWFADCNRCIFKTTEAKNACN